MDLFDSPLRQRQRAISAFHRRAVLRARAFHKPLLYGIRHVSWPAISLQTDTATTPSRHVLEQMVVSGTVTYLPPFPPPAVRRPSGAAPGSTDVPPKNDSD
ncbi:MAG: hypothetical protein Q8P41_10015 [Pseudomonadota bacterium]|nr:hypothetical protein [Pseudomonadota bacterium]